MARKIQVRRGTAANMPVLADGEPGLQTDTGKLYVGNGGVNLSVAMGAELNAARTELNTAIEGKAPANHTHTADQVNAVPKTGGAFTGGIAAESLSLKDYGTPMEIGKYIDFHNPGSTSDNDGRLMIDGGSLQFNGQNVVHSGNIGGQSVNYANTSGNTNAVGGRAAGTVLSEIDNLKTSVANGKAQIASAISDKGVSTGANADFGTMANNIRAIQGSTIVGNTTANGPTMSMKETASGQVKVSFYAENGVWYAGASNDVGFCGKGAGNWYINAVFINESSSIRSLPSGTTVYRVS